MSPIKDMLKNRFNIDVPDSPKGRSGRSAIEALQERSAVKREPTMRPEKLDVDFSAKIEEPKPRGARRIDFSTPTPRPTPAPAPEPTALDRTSYLKDSSFLRKEASRQPSRLTPVERFVKKGYERDTAGLKKEAAAGGGKDVTASIVEGLGDNVIIELTKSGVNKVFNALAPKNYEYNKEKIQPTIDEYKRTYEANKSGVAQGIGKGIGLGALLATGEGALQGAGVLAGFGTQGLQAANITQQGIAEITRGGIAELALKIAQVGSGKYTPEEALKEMPKEIAFEVLGVGMGKVLAEKGLPMVQESLRRLTKGEIDEGVEEAMEQLAKMAEDPVIQKELGLDPGTTAKEFKAQVEAEGYMQGFDKTRREMIGDFNQWRRDNFDGSFGKVPEDEMSTLKELYKEETGISLDEQLKDAVDAPGRIERAPVRPEALPEETDIDEVIELAGKKVATKMPEKTPKSFKDAWNTFRREMFSQKRTVEGMGGKEAIRSSNLNRTSGTVEYNIIGAQTDMDGNEIGKGAAKIFEDVQEVDKKKVLDYVLHRHNIERFDAGKPVFGAEVTPDVSREAMRRIEAELPGVSAKADEITGYFKNLLDEWGVKSGLVDQGTADMLKELYPNYVPTVRLKNVVNKLGSGDGQAVSKALSRARGAKNLADADVIVPVDTLMVAQTNRLIRNARKNELLVGIADRVGEAKINKHVMDIRPTSPGEAIDTAIDIGKNIDEIAQKVDDKYILNFYREGKPFEMEVSKDLYEAFNTSRNDTFVDEVLGNINKYGTSKMKALITDYNPLFAVSNVMRDIPTALVYSDNPLKMISKVPEATKQILTNGDEFKRFKALGGTREGIINAGKDMNLPTAKTDDSMLELAAKHHPLKKLRDLNSFTEMLPRFSEYLAVLEKTGDPALAVYKSAELTTDFSRYGKTAKKIDQVVPYFNASVQGMDKFFRSMRENPLGTIAKAGAAVTAPSIILDQVNKDNPDYQNLTPRERNMYYNVPIPNSREFVRIPKSRELGVAFSSLAEWSLRRARGEKVTGEEIINAIKEGFSPADVTSTVFTPALKAWKQIEDPDAYETNYWGGLIVPVNQRQYSPGRQYDASSSGYAKAIGQQFNISPYVIDYLIDSYTGIIGDVARPLTSEKVQAGPIKKKFINDPVFKNKNVSEFYDVLDEISTKASDFNRENDVAGEITTNLEARANAMRSIARNMSEVRSRQRTEKDPDRVRELQETLNGLAERGIDLFGEKE